MTDKNVDESGKKVLIASSNDDKVNEISQIFKKIQIQFYNLKDFKRIPIVEETGKSFKENAIIKAEYYFNNFKIPVIADDSGLVIPKLNGEPGIHSARYSGIDATYKKNNELLLSKMVDLNKEDRKAHFLCHIIYLDENTCISVEGRVDGFITENLLGDNGFGYDPVFMIPELGKTFGEIDPFKKNSISHRYIALIKLKKKLL